MVMVWPKFWCIGSFRCDRGALASSSISVIALPNFPFHNIDFKKRFKFFGKTFITQFVLFKFLSHNCNLTPIGMIPNRLATLSLLALEYVPIYKIFSKQPDGRWRETKRLGLRFGDKDTWTECTECKGCAAFILAQNIFGTDYWPTNQVVYGTKL